MVIKLIKKMYKEIEQLHTYQILGMNKKTNQMITIFWVMYHDKELWNFKKLHAFIIIKHV
jgi:hypothetical protein